MLNAAGYESFLCGKMDYDPTRRYGFTEIVERMNQMHITGKGGRRNPDNLAPQPGMNARFNEFKHGEAGNIQRDRRVTAGALKFLAERETGDNPFFLLAGYMCPHFPLTAPKELADRHKGKVPMPIIPEGHLRTRSGTGSILRIGFHGENVPPRDREVWSRVVLRLDGADELMCTLMRVTIGPPLR